MSWLWVLPPAVAVTGLVVAMVLVRTMAREARALRHEVDAAEALRPALADLHTELRALRRPPTGAPSLPGGPEGRQ